MRFQSRAPETLNSPQRSLYQRITETRRTKPDAPLPGPFGPWLLIPEIGQHLCELGHALRYQSQFSRAVMEIGILVTARHWRSNFEWYAHAPMAREAGITDTQIEHIKQGKRPVFQEAAQQIAFDAATELVEARALSEATFERLQLELGEEGSINFVALIGYYLGVSAMLNAFDIPVPAQAETPFPP